MARTHEIVKCREHGTIQSQCRCPADNKTVILADCACTPEQIAISVFPKAVVVGPPPWTPQPHAGQKIADILNSAADLDQRRQEQIRRQRDSVGRLLQRLKWTGSDELPDTDAAADEIMMLNKRLGERDHVVSMVRAQVESLPEGDETRIAILAILGERTRHG